MSNSENPIPLTHGIYESLKMSAEGLRNLSETEVLNIGNPTFISYYKALRHELFIKNMNNYCALVCLVVCDDQTITHDMDMTNASHVDAMAEAEEIAFKIGLVDRTKTYVFDVDTQKTKAQWVSVGFYNYNENDELIKNLNDISNSIKINFKSKIEPHGDHAHLGNEAIDYLYRILKAIFIAHLKEEQIEVTYL